MSRADLPVFPTPLIGRERELTELSNLLRDAHRSLVTLLGPGGVGKTRLALQAAHENAAGFADGALFVDLTPVRDPELVISAIAQALGLRDAGDVPLLDRLAEALGERELLLLLDNVEQVVEAAPQLAAVLAACPGLKVLTTSRARLQIAAEQVYPVRPLKSVATEPESVPSAVAFFVDRARAVALDFALTPENQEAVADICRRLDGLPLAIELAAARINLLPPEAMAARLERTLPLLTGGRRDSPARQRTLRDAIAWSHDLLPPEERLLFRRLGVFVGGAPLDAVEIVCAAPGDLTDPLGVLGKLVDSSIVEITSSAGAPRARMLETIREFAQELLDRSDEAGAVRSAHAAWCQTLVDGIDPFVIRPGRIAARTTVDREMPNIRSALDWLRPMPSALMRLVAPLTWYWITRGGFTEARQRLPDVVARGTEPSVDRVAVLAHGAILLTLSGDQETGEAWAAEARRAADALGDAATLAFAACCSGVVAEFVGDEADAMSYHERGTELARRVDHPFLIAANLANLGDACFRAGDFVRARLLSQECVEHATKGDEGFLISMAEGTLAWLDLEADDSAGAAAHAAASLSAARELDDPFLTNDAIVLAAGIAFVQGDPLGAGRLLGAANAGRERAGIASFSHHAQHDRLSSDVAARLGAAAMVAALAEGRRLSESEAFAAAWAVLTPGAVSSPPSRDGKADDSLSPRERDVLALLVAGKTDRGIGEALFISPRTASKHVGALLAKLGVASRTEAAALAVREGLV